LELSKDERAKLETMLAELMQLWAHVSSRYMDAETLAQKIRDQDARLIKGLYNNLADLIESDAPRIGRRK